jgi:hypothetical protein
MKVRSEISAPVKIQISRLPNKKISFPATALDSLMRLTPRKRIIRLLPMKAARIPISLHRLSNWNPKA